MNLCSPAVVKSLLEQYGLAPQKGFGQNFLINPEVPEHIAESSLPRSGNGEGFAALEIGPGLGAMTRELSYLYDRVTAVEIDRGLIPLLRETLDGCDNVQVVQSDFMELDLPTFLKEQFGDMPVHVCANLPYYITTPILMRILEAVPPSDAPQIRSVTVLMQTEVADRLCAAPGSSEYGSISAAIRLAGQARKLFNVSAGNFYPQPKVSSSVVQIALYPGGIRDGFADLPEDDAALDLLVSRTKQLISMAFAQRRKTLVNALSAAFPKAQIAEALVELELRADVRGERLSAEDYIALAKKLYR